MLMLRLSLLPPLLIPPLLLLLLPLPLLLLLLLPLPLLLLLLSLLELMRSGDAVLSSLRYHYIPSHRLSLRRLSVR